MSDYRVNIAVRNANLLRAIEAAGYQTGEIFAKKVGISNTTLCKYLNLTKSPLTKRGEINESALALCTFLGKTLFELWSAEQVIPLEKNKASVELDAAAINTLLLSKEDNDPLQLTAQTEMQEVVRAAIDTLPPRYADVIRRRFFAEDTFDDVGALFNVTRERVRQLEIKGLRLLHAKLSKEYPDGGAKLYLTERQNK
jgi:RNA polymerase sigma factor (sigma-70 family)